MIVALVFALVMLSACFTSKSELPRNTSNAHSNKENTVTVIIEGKSKRYQVKKGTTLLSFAISQLNAKEDEGFITSVGNLRQNTKESIYLMFDENPIKTMTKLFSTKSLEICFLNSIFEFLAMKIPDNITPIEKAIDTSPKNRSWKMIFLNGNPWVRHFF